MIKTKPMLVAVNNDAGISKSLSSTVTADYILDMLEGLSRLAGDARLFELSRELAKVRTKYSD